MSEPAGEVYDAVIVGSGIAGAILAKVLSQHKRRVLLLEAGSHEGLLPDTYQSYVTRFHEALAKAPNSPYPQNLNARTQDVLDLRPIGVVGPETTGYLVQEGPLPYLSDFVRAPGGTTLHWLGTTLRMLPSDFKLRTLYGHGVDWPITYDEIRPFYEMAEREIGVAGDVDDQHFPGMGSDFFGEDYCFPMHRIPQSFLDQRFIARLAGARVRAHGRSHDLRIVSTPQGRDSTPNERYRLTGPSWNPARQRLELTRSEPGAFQTANAVGDDLAGQRCEGNASCVPICPVQAKYNALKTLRHVDRRFARIVSQAVASRIEIDPASGRVTGITYKQYQSADSSDHTVHTARGRLYVIAANAIETAKLVLASEAARSSPDVGRNLMDHPVMLTWGLMPERTGSFRGPGSTSHIAAFRDGPFRSAHAAFIMPVDNWGWGWPTFAPGSSLLEALDRKLFGRALRKHLHDTVPRQFSLHCEFEQLPEATNRVTIDRRFMDRLGNFRPVIHYDLSTYTRAAMALGRQMSNRIFARLGAEDFTDHQPSELGYVTYENQGYAFKGAGHQIGTHRMGVSAADSVVDCHQRSWDHDNLYLVGSGSMATTGTCNPTLTVAALSFWASETILKELSRGL